MGRPSGGIAPKSGKKNRKFNRSRNKPGHKRYLHEMRWIKNKARKIKKYMRKHPNWKPCNLPDAVARLI